MKINCDMGESFGPWVMGQDAAIMPFLDMANIACGMHASDPLVMLNTIRLAKQHGVAIGAHPGYHDLQGFGRRNLTLSDDELYGLFIYQIGALQLMCASEGQSLRYVKPHGALYNTMMKDDHTFEVLLQAMKHATPSLPLVCMAVPNQEKYQQQAHKHGIHLWFEAFVDRAYNEDGRLVDRNIAGSTYQDLDTIRAQAISLIEHQQVTTLTGRLIPIQADTLCVHGDGNLALPTAQLLANLLHDEAKQ